MGVHVLTIGSETFISDLRIRPIKQQHLSVPASLFSSLSQNSSLSSSSSSSIDAVAAGQTSDDYKLTWNLEIRRLRKDDTAFYYCVLNSENAYGQIYKLNVLAHLRFVNKSEIYMDDVGDEDTNNSLAEYLEQSPQQAWSRSITLVCIYDDVIKSPKDQIKWYFNKHRIRNSIDNEQQQQTTSSGIKILNRLGDENEIAAPTTQHQQQFSEIKFSPNHQFTITQFVGEHKNTTLSVLTIHNFNLKYNYGRYRCQYKGLIKTVRIYPNKNDSSTRLLYKQSVLLVSSPSSSNSATLLPTVMFLLLPAVYRSIFTYLF